jgi:energy-coupling factor transport system ATP-binding protein
MMYPLEIKNLSFRYDQDGRNILNGINLEIRSSEITAITGLSGSGKSTLCYCIMGIIPHVYQGVLRGDVLIYGRPVSLMKIPGIAVNAGIIFQDPDTQLFSPTVEDDIAFGPENLCMNRREIAARIDGSLEVAGMKEYRFSDSDGLSGGEKQLIAIASVLSLNPRIIIFDEAMSQLDEKSRERVKSIMKELRKKGRAVVVVENEARNLDMADRLYVLEGGVLSETGINGNYI